MTPRPGRVFGALMLLSAVGAPGEETRLSTHADYEKYIDSLLQVKDFGIHYYDDGAADATVLFPALEPRVSRF
jgi:hypothetical protein